MSQSPLGTEPGPGLKDYFSNWKTLSDLIRQGQSFSGREPHCVFLNVGQTRWADVSGVSGLDFADDGRGAAVTDWDQDGDLDLWITNRTGPRVRFMKNEGKSRNQFLRLQLVGTGHNRDAIGARVELQLSESKTVLSKTLRAGGGFVSQSSKWLHFGLGQNQSIDRVRVRWPDGKTEEHRNLKPNQSYRIQQDGVAREFTRRSGVHLESKSLAPAPSPARMLLTRRLPLPEVPFQDQAGDTAVVSKSHGKPQLITLWASWCPICTEELRMLEDFQYQHQGIDVLALCADDVATGRDSKASVEESRSTERSKNIVWGKAHTATMQALSELQSKVVYRDQPLALPASFLVDGSGRLAAFYGKPIDAKQLAKDLEVVQRPATTMAEAFPFQGRSGLELLRFTPPDVAAAYAEGGYLQDAEEELIRYLVEIRRGLNQDEIKPTQRLGKQVERTYHALGMLLSGQGRDTESRAVFRQGLELIPHSAKLKAALGK